MDIYELLKTEVGLSRAEVDKYFAVTENAKEAVLKLREKAWLETKTYAAMQEVVKKTGGAYHKTPPTFTIPKAGSNPAPVAPPHEEPKSAAEPEPDAYNLKESVTGLGELAPILKDAHGNIIDGFHRKKVDPNWPSVTVGTVDNPVKLELARLATNFCRRKVTKEEMQERIAFLVGKAGLKAEEISAKTGISRATIYRHLPQDLKNKAFVELGQAKKAPFSIENESQTSRQETAPSEYVPKPQGVFQETKPFQETADAYMKELVKCDGCGVYAHQSRIEVVDGRNLCPHCARTEPTAAAPTIVEPQKETESPKPANAVKEIDYKEQGKCCPLCGRTLNPDTYERIKKKFSPEHGGLFA